MVESVEFGDVQPQNGSQQQFDGKVERLNGLNEVDTFIGSDGDTQSWFEEEV